MFKALTSTSLDVLWKKALVCAPRLVPSQVLHWTDPQGPFPVIISISSRGAYKIPCYVFIKQDLTHEQCKNLPVVLDFHGGGFFLGSCLEQAPFCSKLARELGAVVISVDYRMGPVDKFPAAVEDAEDVMRAVLQPDSAAGIELREAIKIKVLKDYADARAEATDAEELIAAHADRVESNGEPLAPKHSAAVHNPPDIQIETSRIAISGFSSGGNLALNLALSLQDPAWPSILTETSHKHAVPLLLFYPSFDARQLPSERTLPPHMPVTKGFWAGVSDLLAPTYLPREQAGHLRASPGLADVSCIHETARMLLVLPGLDSLAEQSEAWVTKIIEDETRVKHLRVERYPEMKHGWTQFPDGWIGGEEKRLKTEIFGQTVDLVRKVWAGDDSVLQT